MGYSIAFGPSESAWWGGLGKAFFSGVDAGAMSGDIPETVFAAFQMTFAIITPALIVGAFVERIKFCSMLAFTVLWALLVYFPVANWVWGGGWLGQMGLIDFAGGTVVHLTAGVAALVLALELGKRDGFLTSSVVPHNLTMSFTGAAMLWVGWFGFNAGSALAADNAAGMALYVTHTSAAAGALTWMVLDWFKFGKASGLGAITGMVAGLATITPAAGSVGPMGGLLLGLIGGVICYFVTIYMKQRLKIDDSLDVFPVHGIGGLTALARRDTRVRRPGSVQRHRHARWHDGGFPVDGATDRRRRHWRLYGRTDLGHRQDRFGGHGSAYQRRRGTGRARYHRARRERLFDVRKRDDDHG